MDEPEKTRAQIRSAILSGALAMGIFGLAMPRSTTVSWWAPPLLMAGGFAVLFPLGMRFVSSRFIREAGPVKRVVVVSLVASGFAIVGAIALRQLRMFLQGP